MDRRILSMTASLLMSDLGMRHDQMTALTLAGGNISYDFGAKRGHSTRKRASHRKTKNGISKTSRRRNRKA